MSSIKKYVVLVVIGFIIVVTGLGIIAYNQHQIEKRQEAIEKGIVGQKELVDKIVRSQNQYATKKDIESFANENKVNVNAIKKDLSKLDADLTSINKVKVISTGVSVKEVKSTSTGEKNPQPPLKELECKDGKCENPDKYNYLEKEQKIKLEEPFSDGTSVPLGEVGFSAWNERPWSLNLYSKEYNSTTIVGTDENRRQYFYNKFTVTVDGKMYELPITEARTLQRFPEAQFKWWNPSLSLGLSGGTYLTTLDGEVVTSLGLSIFSYGKYIHNPEFKFLGVGLGYGFNSDNFHIVVTPVYYNVGEHLPLLNNMYVGPAVSVGSGGDAAGLLGISVGL